MTSPPPPPPPAPPSPEGGASLPPPAGPPVYPVAVPVFEPLAGRARWAIGVLAFAAVLDLVAIASGIGEYRLLSRLERGEFVSLSEADASDTRQAAIGIAQVAVLVAAAVLFILWFHRAYKNLLALGAGDLRFGPGWAIGGWFVPILNLWRPKQIANDVWRASGDGYPPGATAAWRGAPIPALFQFWWGAFLLANWLSQVGLRLSLRGDDLQELQNGTIAYLLSDSVDACAAVLAIFVVRRTTARQNKRVQRLGLVRSP